MWLAVFLTNLDDSGRLFSTQQRLAHLTFANPSHWQDARAFTLTPHVAWLCCLPASSQIIIVAASPDKTLLASGSIDKTVRLWTLPDGVCTAELKGHTSYVYVDS